MWHVTLELDTHMHLMSVLVYIPFATYLTVLRKSFLLSFDHAYYHHDLRFHFESGVAKLQSHVTDMLKRSPICKIQTSSTYVTLSTTIVNHSYHFEISYVWCQWCGKHYGPPPSDHFLSTSSNYLRILSRTSLLVSWSLYASMEISSCLMMCLHHWPSIEWFGKCSTYLTYSELWIVLMYLEDHHHYCRFL